MAQQDPVFQFLNTMPQMLMNVYSQRQREKQAIRDYLNKLNLEIARYGGDIIDVPEGLSAKELERYIPQATREIRETFAEQDIKKETNALKNYLYTLNKEISRNEGNPVDIPEDASLGKMEELVSTAWDRLVETAATSRELQESRYQENIDWQATKDLLNQTDKMIASLYEEYAIDPKTGNRLPLTDKRVPAWVTFKITELQNQREGLEKVFLDKLSPDIRKIYETQELNLDLGDGGDKEPPPDDKVTPKVKPWDKYTSMINVTRDGEQRPTREIPERVKAGTFTDSGVMIDPISAAVMNLLRRFQIPSGTEPPLPETMGRYGEGDIIDLLRQKAQRERGEFVRPQRPTYQTQQYRY